MFWFFGRETCRILAPQLGMKPIPPALEGKVLATGLPGKSKSWDFNLGYPAVGNGGGLFEKWECHLTESPPPHQIFLALFLP